MDLQAWLARGASLPSMRMLLSLREHSQPVNKVAGDGSPAIFLSGPEGGFTPDEEMAASAAGFKPVTLGPRVLRAETAAIAALAALA